MTTKQTLCQTLSDTSTAEAVEHFERVYVCDWSYSSVDEALEDAGWAEQLRVAAKGTGGCPGCGAPCPGERCPLKARVA